MFRTTATFARSATIRSSIQTFKPTIACTSRSSARCYSTVTASKPLLGKTTLNASSNAVRIQRRFATASAEAAQTTTSKGVGAIGKKVDKAVVKRRDTAPLFIALSELEKFDIFLKSVCRMVMCGPQSSGKTSVLEAIAGTDFMPKDMKMATMKPMYVTMIRGPTFSIKVRGEEVYDEKKDSETAPLRNQGRDEETNSEKEAAEMVSRHNKNQKIGKIHIRVISPDVWNSQVIDLPGLYYVTAKDNKNAPKKVRDFTEDHVKDPNNIPIVVNAGPADPDTNEAIRIVADNDRESDSLLVIPKMDLVATNMSTKVIEEYLTGGGGFGYGAIALSLKSRIENDQGKTVAQKIIEEAKFFKEHPKLSPSGVPLLRERISQIQFDKIKMKLPAILAEIDTKMKALEQSGSFLASIVSDPKSNMIGSLQAMIEKLVGSSVERAEFEQILENRLKERITAHVIDTTVQVTEGPVKVMSLPISSQHIDANIYKSLAQSQVRAEDLLSNDFRELLGSGIVSPISIDGETLRNAFAIEAATGAAMAVIEPTIDDRIGKGRLQWYRELGAFMSRLLKDDNIANAVFEITRKELLEYIFKNHENLTEPAKQFIIYVLDTIENESFREKIKFSINAMITMEKRPNVSGFNLTRKLIPFCADKFNFHGGFVETTFKTHQKVSVPMYGPAYNTAYIQDVADSLSYNISRSVKVNLLDNIIRKILETAVDLVNSDNINSEKAKVLGKITALRKIRDTVASYLDAETKNKAALAEKAEEAEKAGKDKAKIEVIE